MQAAEAEPATKCVAAPPEGAPQPKHARSEATETKTRSKGDARRPEEEGTKKTALTSSTPLFRDVFHLIDKLMYTAQRKNAKDMPVVYFSLASGAPFRFQLTPTDQPLVAPFGVSIYIDAKAAPDVRAARQQESRKNLALNIESPEMLAMFSAWDEHNIQMAIKNKHNWFKGDTKDDLVRSLYMPMVPPAKEGYPKQLRTKVNTKGAYKVKVQLYNPELNQVRPMDPEDITNKRVRCVPICEGTSVWFQRSQWGVSLVTTSILVYADNADSSFGFTWHDDSVPTVVSSDQVAAPPSSSFCSYSPGAATSELFT